MSDDTKTAELTVLVELFSTFAEKIFAREAEKETLNQLLSDFKMNVYQNSNSLESVLKFFDKSPANETRKNSRSLSKNNLISENNPKLTLKINSDDSLSGDAEEIFKNFEEMKANHYKTTECLENCLLQLTTDYNQTLNTQVGKRNYPIQTMATTQERDYENFFIN